MACPVLFRFFFFFNDTATPEFYPLPLPAPLPIWARLGHERSPSHAGHLPGPGPAADAGPVRLARAGGRPGPAVAEPGQLGPAGIHGAAVRHGCPGIGRAPVWTPGTL